MAKGLYAFVKCAPGLRLPGLSFALAVVAFALGACGSDQGETTEACRPGFVLIDGTCVRERGPARPGSDVVPGEEDIAPGDDTRPPDDVDPTQDTTPPDADADVSGGDATDTTGPPQDTLPPPADVFEGCDGPGEVPTTLRGVVRIPSGALPLPDVAVYIPVGGVVRDITPGLDQQNQCQPCGDELSGRPLILANTDINGRFELRGIPIDMEEVVIVTEVGKWRRVSTIPAPTPCAVTEVNPELTRLPRNQSEGSLPQFAVTTGGCDALECLLRKIGISEEEFTTESGGGRVHLFHGSAGTRRFAPNLNGGAAFTRASSWWNNINNLYGYDVIVHSCECGEVTRDKPAAATQAMRDYANAGGRLFLSHFHYVWMRTGPADFQSVATWNTTEAGLRSPTTATIDITFWKAAQLAAWMRENGIGGNNNQFEIRDVRASARTLNDSIAQRWAWIRPECLFPGIALLCPPMSNEQPQFISFNTPIGTNPDDQCGRVVHSDIHVSGGDRSSDGTRENSGAEVLFPRGCTTTNFTEQEAVLVFMLFDLSRCVVPDKF